MKNKSDIVGMETDSAVSKRKERSAPHTAPPVGLSATEIFKKDKKHTTSPDEKWC